MFEKIKDAALPTVAIVAALVYFGFVGAGPKTPNMIRPK